MPELELEAVHRKAIADGMIKVGIPMTGVEGCEWCFAKPVSPSHAKLVNVPVHCDHVHYGDVVEFREEDPPHVLLKQFVRVKTQGSHSQAFQFVSDEVAQALAPDQLQHRARRMLKYLHDAPAHIRPLDVVYVGAGWMVGAWAMTADADEVQKFVHTFA